MPAEAPGLVDPGARNRWSGPLATQTRSSLGPDANAGLVARRALASSVELFAEHEDGLLDSRDPSHVHQARVAIRRLRSDLRTFRPLFDATWVDELREELHVAADALGAVRDADVLGQRLEDRVGALPPADRYAADPIVDRARHSRARARDELALMLESRRWELLRARVGEAIRSPVLTDLAAEPAAAVVPPLVRRPWKRLRREVAALGDDPRSTALHETRISVKRCRYAVAAGIPVLGEPAEKFARALARVQDRLGEHQDAITAEAWLRATAPTVDPPAAFSAGALAETERRVAEVARDRWRPAWEKATRKGRDWKRAARTASRWAVEPPR